jgi:predicted XRE-type DNA-binding protein
MKLTAELRGSGNVFDDTHFTKSMATRFKKSLAARMTERMKEHRMTLKDSAERVGCAVDDIRDIRKAEVAAFDISELIALARKLGFVVEMQISIPGHGGRKLH